MTKSGMNLQDSFLNQVRKENTEIMLMLLDGTRLNGYVRGFDNFTVIMNVRGAQHLIYKHAIAQIVSRRITHTEGERETSAGAPQESAPAEGAPGGETPAQPQEAHRREERRDERRDERREGGHRREGEHPRREGGEYPRREGGEYQRREGGEQPRREGGEQPRREGGEQPRREGGEQPRREGGPRREQRDDADPHNKSRFNTIDFSAIKIEQEKK